MDPPTIPQQLNLALPFEAPWLYAYLPTLSSNAQLHNDTQGMPTRKTFGLQILPLIIHDHKYPTLKINKMSPYNP